MNKLLKLSNQKLWDAHVTGLETNHYKSNVTDQRNMIAGAENQSLLRLFYAWEVNGENGTS